MLHVIKHPRGWAVHKHGAKRALRVMREKDDAVRHARSIRGTLYVHLSDGTVEFKEERP